MVVHSIGVEQAQPEIRANSVWRGRVWMLVVWLVCASPVVASYLTFYVIRPQSRNSYGELIEPQRPLPSLATISLDGKPGVLQSLKGQWLLISVAPGACGDRCQEHLYLQRQLRESLGKDKNRVDWVWLVSDDAPLTPALAGAVASATVLRVPEAELASWLATPQGHSISESLYLVDPLGNLMLRFPPDLNLQTAAKAKRDLDRLLRASESWNKARK